jgi:uncharacterized Zn-binding protein involved in type VI secretion
MPLEPVARVGDAISHGGTITAGSLVTLVDGVPVARVGDPVTCTSHGATTIATGSLVETDEGLPLARNGDATACGATIIASLPRTWSSE